MYYYSKWLFFIIFYAISAGLYYLIDKQVILKGFMANFFLGAGIVFGLILLAAFAAAFVLAMAVKYFYLITCAVCKIEKKEIMPKTFWTMFSALSFVIAFIVFWKSIQY
jgi:hypothetical protein